MALLVHHDEVPEINMTPMIDTVFLLLIFFLIGTKFYESERKIDLKLPEVASAKPLTDAPDQIVINVGRDGTIVVDNQTYTIPSLTERLRQARVDYPDQAVLVRGDGRATYQFVAEVMSACDKAGIDHLGVSVVQVERP
jgi:biopolymer transport protein ExbD